MRKTFFTALFVMLSGLFLYSSQTSAATYTIGNGNQYIESKEEFLEFLKGDKINRNPGDFYLTIDIDLEGAVIEPLRINQGMLDGQNHTISNFKIAKSKTAKTSDSSYVGLIRMNKGIVRNLHIKDASVTGYYVVGAVVGANIGESNQRALIQNVTIENVIAEGNVDVGGLVGNSTTNGALTNAQILDCAVIGNIRVTGVTTCGSLTGFNRGYMKNNKVDCINTNYNVTAEEESGGFIGENEGEIYNCSSNASCYSSKVECGGFVGDNDTIIENCSSTGNASGKKYVGGFVGATSGTIKNCHSSGTVTSTAVGKAYVGGFTGINDKGSIYNSSALGNVSAPKADTVGGFIGILISSKAGIYNCRSGAPTVSIRVYGKTDVGGFIGSHSGTRGLVKINKCSSYANVIGVKNVGCFVGKNFGKNGFISYSNSYGTIKGKQNSGAFVGYNANGGRIVRSKKNTTKIVGKKTKFAGKNKGKLEKCK